MPWYEPYLVLIQEWKLGIHLLFNTKYFGVNNKWKGNYPHVSIVYNSNSKMGFIERYKWLRARCFIGFVPMEYAKAWFPIHYYRRYK
jgi:hypothetical protein